MVGRGFCLSGEREGERKSEVKNSLSLSLLLSSSSLGRSSLSLYLLLLTFASSHFWGEGERERASICFFSRGVFFPKKVIVERVFWF